MRFGISSTLVKDRNILELISSELNELDLLEIRCEKQHFPYEDKLELKKLKSIFREYRIKIFSVHPPDGIDIGSGNEHLRIKSIREVQKCILVAHHLNAERIIIHPSGSKSNIDIIIKSLKEIKEFVDDSGKEILIENTKSPNSGSSLEEIEEISKMLNLNICFDTSHYFSDKKNYDVIKKIENKIIQLHISDSFMDGKDDHLFPFEGKIDWKNLFNIIELKNKDIIVELLPTRDVPKTLKRVINFKNRILNGNY